jgi:hypothetical protein
MNVERVAPFFEAFRELARHADRDEPRIDFDAGHLQRNLFRAPRSRAISTFCWSGVTISPSAATAFISALSPA